MSILIRGMEMPKTCWDCACSNYYESIDEAMCDITDERLDYTLWKRERHPDYPLVEVNETLFSADNARKYLKENPPKEESET